MFKKNKIISVRKHPAMPNQGAVKHCPALPNVAEIKL